MLEYLSSTASTPQPITYPFSIQNGELYAEGFDMRNVLGVGKGYTRYDYSKKKVVLPFTDATSIASITASDYSSTLIRKNGEVYVTRYEHTLFTTDGLFIKLEGLPPVTSIIMRAPYLYFITVDGRLGRKEGISPLPAEDIPLDGKVIKFINLLNTVSVLTSKGTLWIVSDDRPQRIFIPLPIKDVITRSFGAIAVILTLNGTIYSMKNNEVAGEILVPFFPISLCRYELYPCYCVVSDEEQKWVVNAGSISLLR